MNKVMTLFGTRPEAIKFAPVIRALGEYSDLHVVNTLSSQHTDLLYPFVEDFGIRVNHDLKVMRPGQQPSEVLQRVIGALDSVLADEAPDMLLVQGDTTTALAGALTAFHREIPVGHIEAGLRSGNPNSPFPEEMNRRLISRVASLHFAATQSNIDNLLAENVARNSVYLTGNPVVDSLQWILREVRPSSGITSVLSRHAGRRLLILTTHRRENFGSTMKKNLQVLRKFVDSRDDVALVFPVHPNPAVRDIALKVLGTAERIELLDPLNYGDFICLLSRAWLIVSDSGGVQEEAPSLGKPLLVIRANTERPEAIESGVAKLVGNSPTKLAKLLKEAESENSWINRITEVPNPFGQGDAGDKIADAIASYLNVNRTEMAIA